MAAQYTCRYCKHTFNTGFFNEKTCKDHCPKCWNKGKQIFIMIGRIIKIMILPVIAVVILRFASPGLYSRIFSNAAAALDSTTLYAYSKDAYVENIIHGRQEQRFYVISEETPYHSSMLAKTEINSAEPLGILPEKAIVELRSVIRRGENVWVPAFFYIKDKPQQAFVLFPRDWEKNVSVYDWNARVKAIKTTYQTLVKNNFKLMEVKPEDEKDYKEKYNDYYKVKDIGEETFFYAPKTDKSQIDTIHSYYLNVNNINMVILQTDKEWERPELVINKTEASE